MAHTASMKYRYYYISFAAIALLLFSSCQHDEPNPIKPVDERKVLLVDAIGKVYNLEGEVVTTLPDCSSISQIIVDGDDYFVGGTSTKDRVGYWKNGKWNTLHVDFIDDVTHKTYGIAKWDYHIYLFNFNYVLRNSGIFPLEDIENFVPARHGISVSEGVCHVVGQKKVETPVHAHVPVIYSEHKGKYMYEILPTPDGVTNSDALAVHAYDRDHVLVGGYVGREPAIWNDNQLQVLPRSFNITVDTNQPYGSVNAITRIDGHIYAAGAEYYDEKQRVATVWCDGVPIYHLKSTDDGFESSEVMDIQAYGSDLYVLTQEFTLVDKGDYISTVLSSVLWMNDKVLGQFKYKGMASFAVY